MAKSKKAKAAQTNKAKAWIDKRYGERGQSAKAMFKTTRTNAENLLEYLAWLRDKP